MASKRRDLFLVAGRERDGDGVVGLRAREDGVELGVARPLREGRPLGRGELVRLTPRAESPLLFDAETELDLGASGEGEPGAPGAGVRPGERRAEASARRGRSRSAAERGGPAQVATESYRRNWEAIWRRAPGQKPN
ncbi:MAG: hypothetical protein FJ104_10985 [Deltaproteobacteria bacterium]|nr:hypothetical protein [Deltaproteobacteria bacterium]